MTAIRNAHIRAARQNPAYRMFTVYRQATDEVHGRPVAGRFFALEGDVYGRVKFNDLDALNRTLGGETGDAVATLLGDWPDTPDAIRDEAGEWYTVTSALGMDSLGVSTKLAVKRWGGDAPEVVDDHP